MPTEQGPAVSRRKLGIVGVLVCLALVVVVVTGIRAREEAGERLREWTDDQAVPTVAVTQPDAKVTNPTIDLPGRLEAYYRAPIFARVQGYLKSWSADIGARVKAGEVIAEIEAPDLDQQLLQARADLASQQASARLSEATLNRRKTLVASNFVSAQEIDERTADLSNKNMAVKAGQANVERLEALAGYKKITAPFEGIVTGKRLLQQLLLLAPVVVEERLDERLFAGKVPVDSAFADARALGDIRDQRIQAMLREHHPGRVCRSPWAVTAVAQKLT